MTRISSSARFVPFRVRSALVRLMLLAVAVALVPESHWAFGQGAKKKDGKQQQGFPMSMPGGGGKVPGMGSSMPGAMPGNFPGSSMPGMGSMPGMPGSNPAGTKGRGRAKKGEDDKRPPVDVPVGPDGLPVGFTPPPEAPEWMKTTDEAPPHRFEELQNDKDKANQAEYRRIIQKIRAIQQAGVFEAAEDRALVEEYVNYRLAQLTRKVNREKAHSLQESLFREINPPTIPRGAKYDVRNFMAEKLVALAPTYLANYHFVPRLQTAILLARLAEVVEVPGDGNKNPDLHCTKAAGVLLEVLKTKDRNTYPPGVRVWAIIGLERLGALPELKTAVRQQILDAFVDQLNQSADEHFWTQWRLVEGIGRFKNAYNAERRPVVAQALARVLVDQSRDWLVRCEAAYSLGQLNYDRDVDLALIAFEIGRLVEQMNQAVMQEPKSPRWKLCYIKVYGAFKPIDDDGLGLIKQVQERPALASFKKSVTDSYDQVLPVIEKAVKEPEAINQAHVPLTDWLRNNAPKVDRINSSEAPLYGKEPGARVANEVAPPAGG